MCDRSESGVVALFLKGESKAMTIKVAINGYGRIGRNILRAFYESGKKHDIQIVAINDLGDAKTNAHLTRFDTAHGRFPGTVTVDGDSMVVIPPNECSGSFVPIIRWTTTGWMYGTMIISILARLRMYNPIATANFIIS